MRTEGLNELRRSLRGDVLLRSDAEFEAARLCFNLLIDRRPAVIARCLDSQDVATALGFAQAHELEVAVRGGGHNPAGHCAIDRGLVIDLSRMRRVEVDKDARLARSGGAPPGSTSTQRRRPMAWLHPAVSWAPPVWPD
jgi:FAD/FMN-containing dehydrogenase